MWNEQKLQQYIDDQVEESINLDYKAAGSLDKTDGKKNEIAKDISAFANSNGGLVIYGIAEQNAGGKYLPEKFDTVDRTVFSKETLEQIINSRISPTIHGIIIHPVTIGAAADNKVAYVVEIPQSNTAHQAYDKRYYRRYNFQSIAMDDWEIKDIINRQTKTQVQIKFRPRFPAGHADIWMAHDTVVPMEYDVIATNTGQLVIHHVDFMIAGSAAAADYIYDSTVKNNQVEHYYTNEIQHKIEIDGNESVINIQRMPILSHTYRVIGQVKFSSAFLKSDHQLTLTAVTDDNRTTQKLTGKEIFKQLIY